MSNDTTVLPSIHPIAEIFPLMSDDEFEGLKADIREHGQRDTITLWKGQVIDGRNRLRACRELGIEPNFGELDDATDPVAWVMSFNLHRRHLTPSQRAMIAARCRKIYDDEAAGRMKATQPKKGENVTTQAMETFPQPKKGAARDKAGEALKVSGKTVDAATKILQFGNQSIIQAVSDGQMTVNRAVRLVTNEPPKQIRTRRRLDSDVGRTVKDSCTGNMQFAQMAILQLERISAIEPDWETALATVQIWINLAHQNLPASIKSKKSRKATA